VSAVDERMAPAEAGGNGPRCLAKVPVAELIEVEASAPYSVHGLVLCGLPAAGYWAGRCPCGHVRDAWLCGPHAELAGQSGCRACRELPEGAHDCPLPGVSRSTPERSS